MATTVQVIECPNCATTVSFNQEKCPSCGSAITFSSFSAIKQLGNPNLEKFIDSYSNALSGSPNDPTILSSLGYILMQRKEYATAREKFKKASLSDLDNSEHLYNAVVASYLTKPKYKLSLDEAQEMLCNLDKAIDIEDRSYYHAVKSHIIKNCFEKKFFKAPATSKAEMESAYQLGFSEVDKADIEELLGERL
jgi:tetratricopeptide (TPR) repeat protein